MGKNENDTKQTGDTGLLNGQQQSSANSLALETVTKQTASGNHQKSRLANSSVATKQDAVILTKGNIDEEEKQTLVADLSNKQTSLQNATDQKKQNDQSNSKTQQQQSKQRLDIRVQNVSPLRRSIRKVIRSKPVIFIIVFLVIIYTILIFVDISMNQLMTESELNSSDNILRYIELGILIVFLVEIVLNSYGTGIKNYFRDRWLVLDFLIIILSLALVIVDLAITFGSQVSSVASIVRALFRFLRIFLLLRKLQNFRKIKVTSTIKTPSEKVLEILGSFKDYFDNTEILQDIDWSMRMIASNKLYEPVLGESGDKGDLVAAWSNQNQKQHHHHHGANHNHSSGEKHSSLAKKVALKQSQVIPTDNRMTRLIPANIYALFEKEVDNLTFDCFELSKLSKGSEVSQLLVYLFNRYNLLESLKIDEGKFFALAVRIQNGYRNNLYHDRLHSFDVTQSVHFMLTKCKFSELSHLESIERAAMYFAASVHDFDHPGVNNIFLINTHNPLALKYNDQSVLENHHISSSYAMILGEDSLNIFQNFSKEDFKQFRDIAVDMVLATDMSKHFADISKLKSRIEAADFEIHGKDKKILMETILHASDVSNPLRPWNICYQWTTRVMAEFWSQGDQERQLGLPISYLCDRFETNTSKSQQGFIDFIVKPLFEVLSNVLPEFNQYLPNFETNKQKWLELVPKYDEELKALKEDKEKNPSKP